MFAEIKWLGAERIRQIAVLCRKMPMPGKSLVAPPPIATAVLVCAIVLLSIGLLWLAWAIRSVSISKKPSRNPTALQHIRRAGLI